MSAPLSRPLPWLLLFVLLSLVQVGTEAVGAPELGFLSKACLMPLLAAWFLSLIGPRGPWVRRRMLGVFFGSWVGDVALMLAPQRPDDHAVLGIPKHDLWFLVGVAGFFAAHLLLISIYRRVDRPERPGPWSRRPWAFAPLVLAGAILLVLVVPRLAGTPGRGIAALPVAVYGSLLVAMVGFASNRWGRVDPRSFRLTLAGALVFLLSDALIGLTILVPGQALPGSGVWIMSTYLAAEFLIAAGIARQVNAPLD